MKRKIVVVVLVICLLAFVAVFAFSQSSPNVRWEYRTCHYSELNEFGAQGWEAVGNIGERNYFLLKRRLP